MSRKKVCDHPTLKVEDYGRTRWRAKRKTVRIEIKLERGIGNMYGMGGLGREGWRAAVYFRPVAMFQSSRNSHWGWARSFDCGEYTCAQDRA